MARSPADASLGDHANTGRNLLHIRPMPEMLMDVTIEPVMFVLPFAFVFGGAITVPASTTRSS